MNAITNKEASMRKMITILGLVLMSSTVFAAQSPEPENIACKIQVIEMKDTKLELLISENTIYPKFKEAHRNGSEHQIIVKNEKFEIGLTLSFLNYSPILELKVLSGTVSVATGLRAEVSSSGSENTTVVTCTYTPGVE